METELDKMARFEREYQASIIERRDAYMQVARIREERDDAKKRGDTYRRRALALRRQAQKWRDGAKSDIDPFGYVYFDDWESAKAEITRLKAELVTALAQVAALQRDKAELITAIAELGAMQ